jgi:6-pyruvoyl-tetrahydropterin synthase
MFYVTVRDHIMIAHSFKGEVFGPAQALHGATFVVDVTFFRPEMTEDNIVIDIGRALTRQKDALSPLNYKNLDDIEAFKGQNTTTEFLAKHIFDSMRSALKEGALGPGSEGVTRLKVTLGESHCAWAGFEGDV